MKSTLTRRGFIRKTAAGSAALTCLGAPARPRRLPPRPPNRHCLAARPCIEGGWADWPNWLESWEPAVLKVLRSGKWYRGDGGHVAEFETGYAKLLGAKRCLATASGTTALLVSLHVMDVDAGDEVIVSPYTFIATYNAILINKALPVFADTDPATLTMDPASIESRITDRTRAILPVHIYGMPCDMDPINAIARKHKLAVIEDACQAWLAEYKGRKCGTLGDLACFSFQNSKHIPCRRRRRRHRQQRRTHGPVPRLPQRRTGHGNLQRRQAVFHPRQQLPHAAVPGRDPHAAVRQAGAGNRAPARERGLPERPPETDSRHPAGDVCRKTAARSGISIHSDTMRSSSTDWPATSSSKRSAPKAFPVRAAITNSISTVCSTRRSTRADSSVSSAPSG